VRILLTGASGFVGHHIGAALVACGHEVVGCSRRRNDAFHRYPELGWIKVDLSADLSVDAWRPRLTGFDAVINAAAIVRERPGEGFNTVNADAPCALFAACAEAGVRRVIQISAPDCDHDPRPYAIAKLRAERRLAELDLDWTVVRSSLLHPEDVASAVARLIEDGGPLGAVLELERNQIRFNVLHARDPAKLHRAL
jgi:nucleoside-diphosphate-sugar epimerase